MAKVEKVRKSCKKGNSRTQLLFPLDNVHIFNKGNNGENIFRDSRDRQRFVDKIKNVLEPVAYICSYILMPNHFHLVLKIRSKKKILQLIEKDESIKDFVQKFIDAGKSKAYIASRIISELLRRFFSDYVGYFNRKYDREGSLLRKSFRRKIIDTLEYLKNCIVYVDRNITNHIPCISYKDYPWGSYKDFIKPGYIEKINKRLFDFYGLFGSLENFIYEHERKDLIHDTYNIE